MTVHNVTGIVTSGLRPEAGRFFLSGAADFASTLQVGEIIKGKVLRQYEGGSRYLVNFGGHERVVDSSMPLSTGELIHGRVIGISDRVELQRVHSESARASETAPSAPSTESSAQGPLADVLNRYNVQLSQEDEAVLASAMRRADDGGAMALAGALVAKLGLAQSVELLKPVYDAMMRKTATGALAVVDEAIPIDGVHAESTLSSAAMRQIAEAIDKTIGQRRDEPPAEQSQSDGLPNPATTPVGLPPIKSVSQERGDANGDGREELAYWLLNAQADGSVAHRIGTLPLLIGNQLVEVDMSFFEQRRDADQKPEARHRKLMFSLQTSQLGRVEVAANLSGTHARVRIVTQDAEKTSLVAGYAEQLRSVLNGTGWSVDEISYETRRDDGKNHVVSSVVEHVISHDSLSRLV